MDILGSLLGIRRIDRVPNEWLMRVFSGRSAMWREGRMLGLLRESM